MMNPQIKVPSLPDAERAVLRSLLLEPEQAQKRLRELPASLFLDDGHKAVLRAIRKLVERGESLDELVLKAHLERSKECDAKLKSTTYILELKDACPSADNFPYWLGELKDYASRREFLQLAQQATELAMDTSQDPETLAAQFADIGKRVIGRSATRKQWITLLSPSEARNYTPPEGSILVGDCHLVRGATCVIGGMAGVGKSRAATALAVAGATGNPYPRQVAALRNSILQAVTPKDIEEIIKAQIAKAKQGDTVAAKFILERVLGRPQVIDLALVAMKARIEEMRVESDEKQQKELYTLLDLIP
jgi:hypothetical protein